MLGAAAALEMPQWAVWLLALSGATSVLTALVGFCPACAMAGRRAGWCRSSRSVFPADPAPPV